MSPRPSRSNWPLVDTIYCEAKCPDEDVYYFGSDDDQYESPRERKRRYELAGQRFLSGSAPRLFSASLRGPFESSRGWKNPWTSKAQWTRIAQKPESQASRVAKSPSAIKTTKHHVEALPPYAKLDKPECHLPSPRSLKTASLSADTHPFLEDEELQAVQAWRRSIRSTEPDVVQQSTPSATETISPLKRKASHNWLKTVPDKRIRTEPIKNHTSDRAGKGGPTLPDLSVQGCEQASLATNARLKPNTRFSPRPCTSQLISPPKHSLAARTIVGSPISINNKPDDEPSPEQQAAATLSSPVSLRNVKQEKSDAQPSPLKISMARNGLAQKPHRVSEDEDFIFDIAVAPLSDLSESGGEESSQETEHANEAALEELQPSVPNEKSGPETDNSSDSDLTKLSDSPELSDVDEPAEGSEVTSTDEFGEMYDASSEVPDIAETGMVEFETESELITTTDEAQVEHPAEAEESPDREGFSSAGDASETRKITDSSECDEISRAAVSHSVLEEATGILAMELHSASDSEIGQMCKKRHVEPTTRRNAASHITGPVVAEDERAQSSPRVTGTSIHSVAEPAVPPSFRIKQESSEFSFKAMFRNLVPTKSWGQLTQLTSGPPQATIHEPIAPATMEEHVLPSVEDVHSESFPEDEHEGAPMATEGGFRTKQLTTSSTGAVPTKEDEEICQHSLAEQGSALTSKKPPTPQYQAFEKSNVPTAVLEQKQMTSSDEPRADKETAGLVAVADVPQEPSAPSDKETTPAPCSATDEMLPRAQTPATPVTAKTPSPVRQATNSEPRFAFKSFAAFTTPSPERLRVKKHRTLAGSSLRHARLKSILSSRHAGSAQRTSNRVSWHLPGEGDTEGSHSEGKVETSHDAPSSPPPRTPLAELPTAPNEKFAKHFSSVVKRTDGLRHRFHVAADTECGVRGLVSSSQASSVVAKGKTTAGDAKEATSVAESNDAEIESRPREATLSVEPMDMVEDMVREMGDFWQAWDVDAELSAAKKAQAETATTASQSHSVWR